MKDRLGKLRLKTRRITGRRRIAILTMAMLMTVLILRPASAPYIAIAASVVMIWGIWARPSDNTPEPGETREPSLWDDSYGAT